MSNRSQNPFPRSAAAWPEACATAHRILAVSWLIILIAAGSASANLPVNQDPPGLLDQNTTSITILPGADPTQPATLVVGYNDDPWNFNGIGTSYSPDGGATWFDSATQMAPVFVNNQDPSVASDGVGVIYAGMLSFDFFPPMNMNSGIYVSRNCIPY